MLRINSIIDGASSSIRNESTEEAVKRKSTEIGNLIVKKFLHEMSPNDAAVNNLNPNLKHFFVDIVVDNTADYNGAKQERYMKANRSWHELSEQDRTHWSKLLNSDEKGMVNITQQELYKIIQHFVKEEIKK